MIPCALKLAPCTYSDDDNRDVEDYFYSRGLFGNDYMLTSLLEAGWPRMLKRRSQRHNQSWERFGKLVKCYISPLRNTHPYSEERFRVKHPRQEHCAVVPLAGISP